MEHIDSILKEELLRRDFTEREGSGFVSPEEPVVPLPPGVHVRHRVTRFDDKPYFVSYSVLPENYSSRQASSKHL